MGRQARIQGYVSTGDIRPMHVSSTNQPGLSGSGRMVAYPDRTAFFWDYFRVAVNRSEHVNE